MKKKFPVTNEHLAKAIADLGEAVGERFDTIDQRFDTMDQKIEESRETLARAIKDLDLRFTANISSWAKDFAILRSWVRDIDERLSALEAPRRRR